MNHGRIHQLHQLSGPHRSVRHVAYESESDSDKRDWRGGHPPTMAFARSNQPQQPSHHAMNHGRIHQLHQLSGPHRSVRHVAYESESDSDERETGGGVILQQWPSPAATSHNNAFRNSCRGTLSRNKHAAKVMLIKDVEDGIGRTTEPLQLWESGEEYQAFPYEFFRKRVYEVRQKALAAPYW
jgi:hypothetical protein